MIRNSLSVYRSYYIVFWCASSMLTPYLGLYYKSSGISGAGIGILSSLYAVFFIMGGLIASMMVDRGIKYKFILYLSVASGFVGAISILIGSKYLFFIPIGLFFVAFCLSAPSPIVDDMLISELHGENHRYSHFRMFGPAGFALGAVIASNVISALDISLIPFLFVAGILVLMIIYRLLPSSYSLKKTKATINFPSPISNKNNASLRRNTGAHRWSNPPFVQCAPMCYMPLHIQSALVAMRSNVLYATPHTIRPCRNALLRTTGAYLQIQSAFEQCVQIH